MIRIKTGWHGEFQYFGRLSKRQARKREALIKDGLDAKVAHQFVFYNFRNAYFRRFRATLQRGITANPWVTFRRCYDDAIIKGRSKDRGGYIPPRRYDPSKPHKTKEQARAQRERTKERKGQYASDGTYLGEVVFDKETGRYIARLESGKETGDNA